MYVTSVTEPASLQAMLIVAFTSSYSGSGVRRGSDPRTDRSLSMHDSRS